MGDHLLGVVVHIDDNSFGTGFHKSVEHIIDHWLAGDLYEWLRDRIGDRAHPSTEPGGQHHRVFDRHRGQPSFSR